MQAISRRRLLGGAAAGLVSTAFGARLRAAEPGSRPEIPRNIVLWICNGLRADTLGCFGHPVVRTPNLDRLAAEGVVFTRFRTVIPESSPSRASLMTGLYPHAHGFTAESASLPASRATLGEMVRRNTEMATGYLGDWRLGRDPTRAAFVDRAISTFPGDVAHGATTDYADYLADNGLPKWDRLLIDDPLSRSAPGPYPEHHFVTTYLADRALDFIAANRDRPFFLAVGDPSPVSAPPPPGARPGLYDPTAITIPASAFEDLSRKPSYQAASRSHLMGRKLSSPADVQRLWASYLALVTLTDKHLGRVFDWLELASLAEDTLFIFTSDRGDLMGSHSMVGPGPVFYEEAVRVPLILCWPRRWRSRRVDRNAAIVDLMPTILEALGIRPPDGIHGRSLLPLINGGESGWEDMAFGEYPKPEGRGPRLRMTVKGQRKLVLNLEGESELYDLETDPDEMVNLLRDPRRLPDAEPLREALLAWMRTTGDPWLREAGG